VINAYIFAQFAGGDFRETMSAIRAIEDVKQAHLMMGPTDIVAYVETENLETLGEIAAAILELDGVARTDTRLAWPV
jgi:DNA-binding Lrp family transcriptional regulator